MKECAVIGAAGKMGRGIALLLLQEPCLLHVIDTQEVDHPYFRSHLTKFAEKKINALRTLYADDPHLVSNEEMIRHFVENRMDSLRFSTDLHAAKNAEWVFEAIIEDVDAKTELFSSLKNICSKETVYFTNTSSIPIHTLDAGAQLNGKIIGLHFYNPPHVQRLVEIIAPEGVDPKLPLLAKEIAVQLGKTCVESADVAGFISNGFLMRELQMASKLAEKEGVEAVDRMTKEELLRPMGIFELVKFIGEDVCIRIASIMGLSLSLPKLKETKGSTPWKSFRKNPEKVKAHIKALFEREDTKLARDYLLGCREIGQRLLDAKIAKSKKDVDTVLIFGFNHLYGVMDDALF